MKYFREVSFKNKTDTTAEGFMIFGLLASKFAWSFAGQDHSRKMFNRKARALQKYRRDFFNA